MKEKRNTVTHSKRIESITARLVQFQSDQISREEVVGEIQRVFEASDLEYLLPRIFWEQEGSLRMAVLELSGRLLGRRAGSFLRKVLADNRTSLSEKQRAINELKDLGQVVDERYIKDMEACDKVVTRYSEGIKDEGHFCKEDMEPLRDALTGTHPALRYSALRELVHQSSEHGVSFLALCFGGDPTWDEELIDLVEHEPTEWTPDLLIRWLDESKERSVTKRIKKALHALRSRGIAVPILSESKDGPPVWVPLAPPKPEGFVSMIDSSGARIVWLLRHRQPRGFFLFYALVHERTGLMDFEPMELSVKQARTYRDEIRKKEELWVVEADPSYCAFVISEAYKRTSERKGHAVETYTLSKSLVEEMLPGDPPKPLIYAVLGSGISAEDPLGETRKLLDHPLLAGWSLDEKRIQSLSSRLQEIQESKIIVHPLQKKDRVESFYVQCAREIFTDQEYRDTWKRRMEETAWVLYKKGYEQEAQRAVRVACLLSNATEDLSKSAFIVEMIRRSIEKGLEEKKKHDAMQPSLIVKP